MRIGILTWFRNANYGGCLQGLAVGQFLKKQGYQIGFINYSPTQLVPWSQFGLTRFIPLSSRHVKFAFWNWISLIFPKIQRAASAIRMRRSADFIRCYFPDMSREIGERMALDLEVRNYDRILVGSDQIWNPEWIHDGAYLLYGIGKGVKKVSYAASIGQCEIPSNLHVMYASALEDFSALSVREHTAQDALEQILVDKKRVAWAVDPTLLLTMAEWRNLMGLRDCKQRKKTLVCYWLADKDKLLSELEMLHNQLGCEVHLYMNVYNRLPKYYFGKGLSWLRILKTSNAKEFIQDLSDADYVLTDSFHALMFSVIFHRNVRVLISKGRESMSSRIYDFCDRIQMQNCICNEFSPEMFNLGNSMWNEKILEEWIRESGVWLLNALR